jgi:hypothetical protein
MRFSAFAAFFSPLAAVFAYSADPATFAFAANVNIELSTAFFAFCYAFI